MHVIGRVVRRLGREETGVALVFALMTCTVLALTSSALVLDSAANQTSSYHSAKDKQAFALAQAALAYAEGAVYSAHLTGVTPPVGSQLLAAQPGGGTATYTTSVAPDGVTWTFTGTANVGGVTRSVAATANVPSTNTVDDISVWNYLYSNSTAHTANQPMTSGCDTAIDGDSANVSDPLFVRGNFCLLTGAHYTGSQLVVGGTLSLASAAYVGTSAKPVATVNISGTPSSTACNNNGNRSTPGTGYCDGKHQYLYATAIGTSSTDMTMPAISLTQRYADQAKLAKSGCPAGLFDNDSTLNNSGGDLTNKIFPAGSSYDCWVGSNEIKWSGGCAAATLLINGTFYFDGSLNYSSGNHCVVTYSGRASIYLTGTVDFVQSTKLCGVANCATTWNPDVNAIIMLAGCWTNSTGSTLDTDGCVHVGSASVVQMGSYVTTNYKIDGPGSQNMGPVLADSITLHQGTASTLIPFHIMPPGTPVNTRVAFLPASPPTAWRG